ncbi:MAG: hypothetical protein IPN01_10860 [Deltaproteobacteria bacterium]|nr:hypothetical protein [Deltaproteobacteria bacterium]
MASSDFLAPTLALAAAAGLAFLAASRRVRALEERFGLSVLSSSGLPFVLLGAWLASSRVGMLNGDVLDDLRPAFEFGLGWLGFVIGARIDLKRIDRLPATLPSVVGATALLPMMVLVLICAPTLLLLGAHPEVGLYRNAAILAACGVACAVPLTSATAEPAGGPPQMLPEVTKLNEILALAVLGVVTVLYRPDQQLTNWSLPPSAWALMLLGLGSLFGVLGYGLIRTARSEAEEFALIVGLVALAAGVSGYMALSVPVVCAFAGATLINLPVRDREGLVSTLDSVSRPLYLVSLVIVGATWDIGLWQGWVLALVYAFARLLGALLGGLWAKHVEPEGLPSRAEFISALIPQSPVAVVVIVAASTAWVGERPESVRWTITAVILGAVFVDILARPLRVALRRREVSP